MLGATLLGAGTLGGGMTLGSAPSPPLVTTTPGVVVIELPDLPRPLYAGTDIYTTAAFMAPAPLSGELRPVTPTTVTLRFRMGRNQPWTTWTPGAGVVELGVGLFSAVLAAAPGRGVLEWSGTGTCQVTGVRFFSTSRVP